MKEGRAKCETVERENEGLQRHDGKAAFGARLMVSKHEFKLKPVKVSCLVGLG